MGGERASVGANQRVDSNFVGSAAAFSNAGWLPPRPICAAPSRRATFPFEARGSEVIDRSDRVSLTAFPIAVLVGVGIALAGSHGGASAFGLPIFALAVACAFLIQWVAFVPAYILQSERFFDIVGSATYLLLTLSGLLLSPSPDGRSILLAALVVIWALRLGSFLFRRIHATGKDDRFDEIKRSFIRFLNVWTLQGVWVSVTLGAALAAITTTVRRPMGVSAAIGFLVWIVGFAVEVAADAQKARFRRDPSNQGEFIRIGLWAWSRHPNYFGEIVLWVGVALVALPVLRGWQLITLISPLFVALLLTQVSGVPKLERRADEKWGGRADYEAYKASTPLIIPRPPSEPPERAAISP